VESIYPDGWQDDTTTIPNSHISVPGWYLYHPIVPATENGFNGHQRFRMGPGQNTGGFWGFGLTAFDTEKALGSIGSTTTAANGANMYIALRLTNGTAITLNSFSLTYDGEQWRDGQSASGETLSFDYSLTANDTDWFSSTGFTPIPALNFTSPVFADTNTSGTPVNGSSEGRVPDITATINDISWAPGTDLWLRWADPQLAGGADDGLAIDEVRFVAIPEPGQFSFVALALIGAFRCRRCSRRS
jgi:hypothetical protein